MFWKFGKIVFQVMSSLLSDYLFKPFAGTSGFKSQNKKGFRINYWWTGLLIILPLGIMELLGDHCVLVRWIQYQKHGLSGVQAYAVAIANVRITGNDLTTNSVDLFLLGDDFGVPC